jgi:quinol monooxygenase YgiN
MALARKPLVHTAHLRAHPEHVDAFRERLLRHARISREVEFGCLHFDICESRDEPGLFLLVEIYADEDALETHRASPHYLAFRADVKDWVAQRSWYFWNRAEQNSLINAAGARSSALD